MHLNPQTFTVSLKVATQNIKLTITVGDSADEVFQKLRVVYPNCSNNKTQILQKLIASLQTQLLNQSLNPNLVHSISQFLERNKEPSEHRDEIKKINISRNQMMNTADNTPLQESHQNKQNQKQAFQKKMSCQSQKNQYVLIPKRGSVPSALKAFTPNKQSAVKKTGKSIERTKCNPDVIKACEIIMKKTQNTDMKQMAKDFLKEKGYLKEEKQKSASQIKKRLAISDSVQNSQKKQTDPIANERSNYKHQESVEQKCESSVILSNISAVNADRKNNRFNKYKYLQSSLTSEPLSKDYQSFNRPSESSIIRSSAERPKKYSYLE